jgi:hypothetical protein
MVGEVEPPDVSLFWNRLTAYRGQETMNAFMTGNRYSTWPDSRHPVEMAPAKYQREEFFAITLVKSRSKKGVKR